MKKLISIILTVLLLSSMMTACSPNSNNSKISKVDKHITTYPSEGRVTKLIPDPNATGELTIAIFGNKLTCGDIETDQLCLAIEKYKELYPNVKINLKRTPYVSGEPNQSKNYYKKLATETMSGKGPDIFFITGGSDDLDLHKLASAGALADLTDYFKNDENFNINDYNSNVFYGSQISGKQFIVPWGYVLPLFLTTKEVIDYSGFNKSKSNNFFNLYNELDRIETLYKDGKIQCNSTTSFINMATYCYPTYSGVNWINHENKFVNVNSPEMKQMLELYKKLYYEMTQNLSGLVPDHVKLLVSKKTVLTYNHSFMYMLDYYQNLTKDATPIVIPWRDINGNIQAKVEQYLAVSNACKNKENAYRFTKVYISPDVLCYKKVIKEGGGIFKPPFFYIPILNQAVRSCLEDRMSESQNKTHGMYHLNDGEKHLTQKFVDEFMGYLSQTRLDDVNLIKCEKILHDEMKPFLEGKRSYEECIKQAQEKLEIYISE